VIYFGNPSTQKIRDAVSEGHIGYIATPTTTNKSQRVEGAAWCADNGCFGKHFDVDRWWEWLQGLADDAGTCTFATAPDIVGNHAATLTRSLPWLPRIRALGFPAAFVGQDGAAIDTVPWDAFDVFFVGGSTDWKLGPEARRLVAHAKSLGMWVHMGRVNSHRRFRYADAIGCDSADGTYLIWGPDVNLPDVLHWVSDVKRSPALFRMI
jgi:hypothetical protein